MAMKTYYIHATNLPDNIDRELLLKTFQPFGIIRKIYINPEKTFAKVYFAAYESAERAALLTEQPPYYMKLLVESEFIKIKNIQLPISVTDSNMASAEDCYTTKGAMHYNIHGIEIPTLLADDDTLYVALKDVKDIGFALFTDDKIPGNLNFNKQMIDEFKIYLNMKARKYIDKMQCTIHPNIVEEVKREVLNKYVNSGAIPKNTSRQSDSTSPTTSIPSLMNRKVCRPQTPTHNEPEVTTPLRKSSDNSPSTSNGSISSQSKRENSSRRAYNERKLKEKENINGKVRDTKSLGQPIGKCGELPLNKPVQVTVSFVEDQGRCWVVKKAYHEKLGKILEETNFEASKRPPVKPVVGQVCAAMFCGAWYRALVHEVTPAVKLHFIDFGNFNDKEVKDVRELPAKLAGEPALAMKLNFTTPSRTQLVDNVNLNVIALKKNDDGSYQVEEASDRNTSNTKLIHALPSGKIISANSELKHDDAKMPKAPSKPKSVNGFLPNRVESKKRSTSAQAAPTPAQNSPKKVPEGVPSLTLKEKLEKLPQPKKKVKDLNSTRKSVVDTPGNITGDIEFVSRSNGDSCVAFVFPHQFFTELETLDEIRADDKSTSDFSGKVGNIVSVYKEDTSSWVRGTIIEVKNNEYVVALIDYGTITTTSKVGKLEKRFLDIPEFSCVCSGHNECIDLLEKNTNAKFTSDESNKIKLEFNGVFYNVDCKRWDPLVTSTETKNPTAGSAFTTPPSVKQVNDGERVMIVALNDGKLLLRTKETHNLINKIIQDISSYEASPLSQKPVINQLVLALHETQPKLCRGIVRSLTGSYAEVEFIDYGFTDTIPFKDLKTINKPLATEYSTLVPISLKGFEDGQFSDLAIDGVTKCITELQKLLTKKCGDNVFDLFSLDGDDPLGLSAKLRGSTDVNRKYANMKKWVLGSGKMEDLLCLSIDGDNKTMAFLPGKSIEGHFVPLNDKISEYRNIDPYNPELDELCLAKYEGDFSRAKVDSINDGLGQYTVYFIDYGNTATVSSEDIRKLPDELCKIPALAIIGRLTELVNNPTKATDIWTVIEKEVTVGTTYNVKIIRKLEDGPYEISISQLSSKIH